MSWQVADWQRFVPDSLPRQEVRKAHNMIIVIISI